MKSIDIEIREAKEEDLTTLKSFEQAIIEYERPYAPNLKEDPITYYDLLDLIERSDADIVVAIVDGKLIGSGYSLIKKSADYKKPDYYAYLGFMYVLPNYRGKGIIQKVIESLLDKIRVRDITEVQLDVYAENESAMIAYNKIGFKSDLLKMRLNTEAK